MAAVELDPIFVKALKLLQSNTKDSGAQLKAMLDDVIAQRKGLKTISHSGDFDKVSLSKGKTDSELRRKDAEKRSLEKGTKDSSEPDVKKSKLEQSSKQKEKEKESRDKERERQKREKEKKEEAQRERDRVEKEKKEREEVSKLGAEVISDEEEPAQSMDAGDFARDLGINCVVCRHFDVSSGNQLVECQECHSLYHQECHKPPVTGQDVSDPRFVWYCSRCTKSFKKMMSQKPVKAPKSSSTLSSSMETFLSSNKPSKQESDTGSQAFRRIDPKAIAAPKETSNLSSTSKGMVGLAGLAANLTKPRGDSKSSSSSKKSEHKSDGSKSGKTEPKSGSGSKQESGVKSSLSFSGKGDSRKADSSSKSSTSGKEEQWKDGKKTESFKSKPEEKKSTETSSSSSSSKKDEKKERSDHSSGKSSSSSKDDKKSDSRSKSGSSHSSSPTGGSSASGSGLLSSGDSGSKSSNKQAMANLFMVTANKRIQMMKKKAQSKPQDKIVHIK